MENIWKTYTNIISNSILVVGFMSNLFYFFAYFVK